MSTLNGKMFVVAAALVAAVGCVQDEDQTADQPEAAESSEAPEVEGAEAEDVSADETQEEDVEAKPSSNSGETPATQGESE